MIDNRFFQSGRASLPLHSWVGNSGLMLRLHRSSHFLYKTFIKKALDSRNGMTDTLFMSNRYIRVNCDSWDSAVERAKADSRIKGSLYAVEYMERDSPDDMRFFESLSAADLIALETNYVIVRRINFRKGI